MRKVLEDVGGEPVLSNARGGNEEPLGQLFRRSSHSTGERPQPRFDGGLDVLTFEFVLSE